MNIKSTLIIIGTLLIGMLIGFAAAGRLAKHRIHAMHKMSLHEKHEEKMLIKRLDLTDDQKPKVRIILEKHKPAQLEQMKDHRHERDSLRAMMFEELVSVLSDEQKEKLKSMKEEHRWAEKRHGRHLRNK